MVEAHAARAVAVVAMAQVAGASSTLSDALVGHVSQGTVLRAHMLRDARRLLLNTTEATRVSLLRLVLSCSTHMGAATRIHVVR